jgi:hypothetical protein
MFLIFFQNSAVLKATAPVNSKEHPFIFLLPMRFNFNQSFNNKKVLVKHLK